MRILLLGEFSAFHQTLKEGLELYDHNVTLASGGDGYRNYARDINLNYGDNIIGKVKQYIFPLINLQKFVGYDIVQWITPYIFGAKFNFNKILSEIILKYNKKSFLCATGTDSVFMHIGSNLLRYNPIDDYLKIDKKGIVPNLSLDFNKFLAANVNGIIPSMYDYKIGYTDYKNLKKTIPLPMNFENIEYHDNLKINKLVFFHGVSRPGFKGSREIIIALEKLKKKYPNDCEVIIVDKLPYIEYKKALKNANVVVDQVNSYSWGMNAIISMGMGKVVASGAEFEGINEFGLKNTPIINIVKDENMIFNSLARLLDDSYDIRYEGMKSSEFVRGLHDYKKIAKQYLSTWEQS